MNPDQLQIVWVIPADQVAAAAVRCLAGFMVLLAFVGLPILAGLALFIFSDDPGEKADPEIDYQI